METCKPRKKRKKLLICVRSKLCKEKKVPNLHKECHVSLLYSFAAKEERKELQMEASKPRQKREKERIKFFIDHTSSTSS
jgi:hypothetical protein